MKKDCQEKKNQTNTEVAYLDAIMQHWRYLSNLLMFCFALKFMFRRVCCFHSRAQCSCLRKDSSPNSILPRATYVVSKPNKCPPIAKQAVYIDSQSVCSWWLRIKPASERHYLVRILLLLFLLLLLLLHSRVIISRILRSLFFSLPPSLTLCVCDAADRQTDRLTSGRTDGRTTINCHRSIERWIDGPPSCPPARLPARLTGCFVFWHFPSPNNAAVITKIPLKLKIHRWLVCLFHHMVFTSRLKKLEGGKESTLLVEHFRFVESQKINGWFGGVVSCWTSSFLKFGILISI